MRHLDLCDPLTRRREHEMHLVYNLIVLYDHELEKEGLRLSSREFPDEHYRRSENILGEAREGPWPAASGRPLETW